ncbi:MAG: metallophosphoesterase [Treponema sp.]|nr:metallophosphoesterase [Treponema sp.]
MEIPHVKKKILVFLLISVSASVFFILSCTSISVKNYEIDTPLLAENTSIKIILIADLHSTIYGREQTTLIEKIREENPDLIVMAGDILDDDVLHLGTELLLEGIKDIAPIFYVTGNHEYWSRDIQGIRELLLSYQVNILSDNYVRININGNEIIIAGTEDPHKRSYEDPSYDQELAMENAFRELDDIELFKIFAAHRPERIEAYKKYSFDLILSGHTHGGQVRIPLILNGLLAPNQGLFPKYGGGLYRHGEMVHIISRGLSINPLLPRIFNNPELVIIIVKSSIITGE